MSIFKPRFFAVLFFILSVFIYQSASAGQKDYKNRTIVYYGGGHSVQVEYYSPKGRAYLWYPGNRRSLPGKWKISESKICFTYGTNTYNPVTKRKGRAAFRCSPIRRHAKNKKYACLGDVFKLRTGRLPYVLKRGVLQLARIRSKCRGKI